MKIYEEKPLKDFEFWSGAADRAASLTDEDFDTIEAEFESLYPDGMEDTQINDIFWFEFDFIVQILGYEDEEDFDRQRSPDYVSDEELKEYGLEYFRRYVKDIYHLKQWDQLLCLADSFGIDYDEPEDDDSPYPNQEELDRIYDELYLTKDEEDVYDTLFDEDEGNSLLGNEFPTWEYLREIKIREDAPAH